MKRFYQRFANKQGFEMGKMTATKKQKIRLEKIERLIVPNVIYRFCPQCQSEQFFVSTEQATLLTNRSTREMFRLVETEVIHLFETAEGLAFFCGNSCKPFQLSENVEIVFCPKLLSGEKRKIE